MKNTIAFFFATAGVLVLACNHESAPAKPVTTTGAGVVGNEDAVNQLTEAYCDRAKACNYLGKDERFTDEAACRRQRSHDLHADLRPGECPRGIRAEKLQNCLQEIQNHKCGNALDHLSRMATCRTGSLCID